MNKQQAKDATRKHCGPPEFSKGESRLYEAIVQQTRSLPGKDWIETQIEDSKCPSSIMSLSRAARLSEDRVKRGIKKFQNKRLLIIHIGTGFKGKNEYTVLPTGLLTRPELKIRKPQTNTERSRAHRQNIVKQLAELKALQSQLDLTKEAI